jgi:pyridoxamine 5'-phosphate oxidase
VTGAEGPIAQIIADRERARTARDPFTDLCVLATADRHGALGVRTLVLRDVGPSGVGLLVSATSPKWAPLADGRYECLLVWLAIRRQYRIRGGLAPMPAALVERYWREKQHESRLLDAYYATVQAQSSRVASRESFLAAIARLRQAYPTPEAVPRPEVLRGVYLVPERIEAWHGSPDRLHERRLYSRDGPLAAWTEAVLVP